MHHDPPITSLVPFPARLDLNVGHAFDEDDVQRHAMGGGILPLAFDPEGQLHVLLGRERFVSHWRGSCRWSGFEGSRKEGETIEETAVREFYEETLAAVLTREEAARIVAERDYWLRIVLRIANERSPYRRYHVTFVVLVDWNAHLPAEFQAKRSHIEYVDRLVHEWNHARPSVLLGEGEGEEEEEGGESGMESSKESGVESEVESGVESGKVSGGDLVSGGCRGGEEREARGEKGAEARGEADAEAGEEDGKQEGKEKKEGAEEGRKDEKSRRVDVGPVEEGGDTQILVQYSVPGEPVHTAVADAEARSSVLAWDALRQKLTRALRTRHPALRVREDARWGTVQSVQIVKDFLEKDQIRWWRPDVLREVLHGRGVRDGERFRPYFLPVLQTLLDEVRRAAPRCVAPRPTGESGCAECAP